MVYLNLGLVLLTPAIGFICFDSIVSIKGTAESNITKIQQYEQPLYS